ncbi:protein still life, isoform SIF type 1-like isoform X4 [Mytilus edulis]|uniref:protein still life, isoform SIF type 1-like isoform X4 n=1 Tax=Mytilus edulis TaxID=6550 RepID=UPI0039F13B69
MGNKLCAPLLKKTYRNEEYPWHIRKDSHLLRLWAEIFRVHGDGEYMSWERISEDVVPINISCIEDTPTTVFQITAYNRHVEKIFDVKIIQPGTIICPATESFVHWRDGLTKYEWGLNFTTPADAKRFRDCCSNLSQKFSRKATSASSLRLSPPKRIRGKDRSISSPNSPVHNHHRRTISSPHELHSDNPLVDNHVIAEKKEKSATIPRSQMEAEEDAQLFKPTGILKPSSTSSVYDNYDNTSGTVQLRKSSTNDSRFAVNRKSMPAPASSHVSFVEDRLLNNTRPASAIHFTQKYLEENSARSASVTFSSDTKTDRRRANQSVENIQMETAFVGDVSVEDLPKEHTDRVRVLAPKPVKALSPPQRKSSSSSPEWPSPPEPLTPLTPLNPEVNVDFDSDVLRKMLQSLPVSPEEVKGVNCSNSQNKLSDNRRAGNNQINEKSRHRNGSSSSSSESHKINGTGSAFVAPETSKSKQTQLVEYELRLRDQCARQSYTRDSYPDSGIGGMAGDNATVSEASIKDQPQGLEIGSSKSGSCGNSSHGSSSSGRHSDLVNQLSEGSDLKQYFSPELSDDDGAESDDSIHTMTEAESKISYKQFGAIRKAGWLVVKNWLVQRKRRLEHAPKRKWKRYWVCLKGTVLLFYDCNEQNSITEESVPRHILVIEGGIAQAVPEHPKRDNIFSLSTAFGDAYLFQALSSTEVENWICAIHSACASSLARQHGKDNSLKLIKSEQHKLENNIDVDVKMKKMAELQLTVVTDPRSRQAIIKQIAQWEENLEKLYIEQYRLRCYISTLQGSELPNPKVLLANASKTTKATLGKLGVFTVTSFHALVAARRPLIVPNIYGKGSHKGGMLSPRGDGTFKYSTKVTTPASNLDTSSVYKATDIDGVVAEIYRDVPDGLSDNSMSEDSAIAETLSRISLPNQQTILVNVNKHTIIQDLLESVCGKRQLNIEDHYVRVKLPSAPQGVYTIPEPQEIIRKMKYESIEVCEKNVFQIDLVKSPNDTEFGFAVEAELAQSFERDDELRLYVSNVLPSSVAMQAGLMVGDEILVINSKVVSELDMVYIENLLHTSQSLCCTIRSIHTQKSAPSQKSGEIDNMMCPPPPSQSRISEDTLGHLIVPSPADSGSSSLKSLHSNSQSDVPTNQIDALLSSADQVTAICRTDMDPKLAESLQGTKPLSEAQKLRKVIMELIDTERAYVKDLEFLIDRYLEPLKEETFMSTDDVDHLFGNIHEISQFQKQFLQSLEEAMQLEGDFLAIEDPKLFRDLELRRVLFSLGGSFLFYANHFKVYSSFCASHTRSQKILNPVSEINQSLKEFLQARNPKQQHSATLESYLIKPIQRILKYPLLLQQLCNLTDDDTDEHYHLSEALKGMEAVAEHINEMQKIFEEYGSVFDELSKMFKEIHPQKKPVDLSVGELQMYGTVEWCNICDSLGKVKKNLDLENIVFVFKTGVVFLCRERIKRRKSKGNSKISGSDPVFEFHERFRTLIPVQEVQVQGGRVSDIDRHYWWDLIHCRSDKDGRPERVYQFCNSSVEAKSDFMKIIRQTIRESVRKMTLPPGSQPAKGTYAPFGGQRLQKLPSNIRTLSKLRKGSAKSTDVDRHSAEFEEKINVLESEDSSAFRIRSRTVGDLNDMENDEDNNVYKPGSSEPQICIDTKSSCSSNSSLSSSSKASGSAAKLTQASGNPLTFSSGNLSQLEGSPVWKPRNESNVMVHKGPHLCVPSSAISSSLVNSAMLNNNLSNKFPDIKDTEC